MSVAVRGVASEERTMAWNGSTFESSKAFTTQSGDNVLVLVLTGNQLPPDTVTFNSVALTQRRTVSDTSGGGVHLYDIDGPDIGAYSVVVRRSGNTTYRYLVFALTGVDTGSPRGNGTTATANSGTSVTASVSTTAGQMVIGAASTLATATTDGGQTELVLNALTSLEYASLSNKEASGTPTSLTWTQTSARWAVALQAYNASASSSLTDVDTDETITTGQAAVPYTATGAADADGMYIKTGTKEVACTSFVATNATSGTFTAPTLAAARAAGIKFGACTYEIRDGVTVLGTLPGTFNPETGWEIHNVSTIASAGDSGNGYYGQSPAIAVGDQFLHNDFTTTHSWDADFDSDGFVIIDSGGSEAQDSFTYYIWDATDETWGTAGTWTANEGTSLPGTLQDIFEWLYASGVSGGVMKRTKQYLNSLGYTGSTNSMMYEWLGGLGYTGSLTSRIDQFERANTEQHGS